MAVPLLDLKAQHRTIRDEVLAAVLPIIDDQTFILGEPVERLEKMAGGADRKTKHAIGCANGTDAILLALRALDIGRGDVVVTTPFAPSFATQGAIHITSVRNQRSPISIQAHSISPHPRQPKLCSGPLESKPSSLSTSLGRWPLSKKSSRCCQSGSPSSKTPHSRSARGVASIITGSGLVRSPRSGPSASSHPRIWAATATVAWSSRRTMLLPHGSSACAPMAVSRRTTMKRSATTAGSTHCRPPYWRPNCRISKRGVPRAAAMRRCTTTRSRIWMAFGRRSSIHSTNRFTTNTPYVSNGAMRYSSILRNAASATPSIIRCRCTCNRVSPIWGTRKAIFPRANEWRGKSSPFRRYPELSDAQRDEVISTVRTFYGR